MGCIEAHGERRQIVDSKSFVYPCLSMDMEANYLKETARRSPQGQVLLVLLWGFAECGNRKALRLKAQGVYLCK